MPLVTRTYDIQCMASVPFRVRKTVSAYIRGHGEFSEEDWVRACKEEISDDELLSAFLAAGTPSNDDILGGIFFEETGHRAVHQESRVAEEPDSPPVAITNPTTIADLCPPGAKGDEGV